MNTAQLERECRSYARYLIGQDPTPYVIGHYLEFHRQQASRAASDSNAFDDFLTRVSAQRPFFARLADAYASAFRKDSAVRKKLVLTLALLECAPLSFEALDRTDGASPLGAIARLGWGALQYSLALAVSVALFAPVRAVLALSANRRATEPGKP